MNTNATPQQQDAIDVARVCELANLALDPAELPVFQEQMAKIVEYVRKIRELDVAGIEPTTYGQPVSNVLRDDVIERWEPGTEAAIANAPDASGNEFRVPRVVE